MGAAALNVPRMRDCRDGVHAVSSRRCPPRTSPCLGRRAKEWPESRVQGLMWTVEYRPWRTRSRVVTEPPLQSVHSTICQTPHAQSKLSPSHWPVPQLEHEAPHGVPERGRVAGHPSRGGDGRRRWLVVPSKYRLLRDSDRWGYIRRSRRTGGRSLRVGERRGTLSKQDCRAARLSGHLHGTTALPATDENRVAVVGWIVRIDTRDPRSPSGCCTSRGAPLGRAARFSDSRTTPEPLAAGRHHLILSPTYPCPHEAYIKGYIDML